MIRAPSLPWPPAAPRTVLALLAAVLAALALFTAAVAAAPQPLPARAPSLSERLDAGAWAFAIPVEWLAAPIPGLAEGDVVDLLGARPGERATASEVAAALRVVAIDDATLVVELTPGDAAAIVAARARGLELVPILRSAR